MNFRNSRFFNLKKQNKTFIHKNMDNRKENKSNKIQGAAKWLAEWQQSRPRQNLRK